MNKFIGCRKCNSTKGYIIENNTDGNEYVAIKCNCLIKYQEEEQFKLHLKESNVLEKFNTFNIASYQGLDENNNLKLIDLYIENFKKEFTNYNLYFYGDYGTQKTYLSKYIISELFKQKISCYYILADQLIKLLIDIRRDESLNQRDLLLNKDFLVIDELSDDKCTIYQSEYQLPFFTSFLKDRLEIKSKSTLFISNYPIETLYKSKFGGTIADLINRECKDKLLFKDNYFSLNKNDIKNIGSKLKQMMEK